MSAPLGGSPGGVRCFPRRAREAQVLVFSLEEFELVLHALDLDLPHLLVVYHLPFLSHTLRLRLPQVIEAVDGGQGPLLSRSGRLRVVGLDKAKIAATNRCSNLLLWGSWGSRTSRDRWWCDSRCHWRRCDGGGKGPDDVVLSRLFLAINVGRVGQKQTRTGAGPSSSSSLGSGERVSSSAP